MTMRTNQQQIDRVYREPEVREATGWSHATLWQRIKDGQFAKPVKLGARAVGWFGNDIVEHQEKLRAQREPA